MNPFSFTKKDRLLNRTEFLRLSKHGKKIQNRYFIALFCQNHLERRRLGITVTKRVGCAVIRNRIKRLCREYFRLNREHFKGNWDINLIAKKETAVLSGPRVFSSLQEIFDSVSRCVSSDKESESLH